MSLRALLAFAARRVALRPGRFVLLAASVFVLALVTASVLLFQQAVERTALAVVQAGPSLVVSRVDAGGWASIPTQEAARIEGVRGVAGAKPRVWGVLPGPPAVTVVGTGDLADDEAGAVVGAGVQGASSGSGLVLRGLDGKPVTVQVRQVLPRNADLTAYDTVLVSMGTARQLLLLDPGHATDIAVESVRPEEDAALVGEIAAGSEAPLRIVTRSDVGGAYVAQLGQRGGAVVMALVPAALALALLVAGLIASSEGARREVGKLKLLGWTTGQVATLHLAEVGLAVGTGTLFGLVLAYAQVFLLGGGPMMSILLGWGPSSPALLLDPQGAAITLIEVGALVLAPCVFAAVVPAWRLAHSDPADLIEAS